MNATDPLNVALEALRSRAEAARKQTQELETRLAKSRAELEHAEGAIDHIQRLIRPAGPAPDEPTNGSGSDEQKQALLNAVMGLSGMEAVELALRQSPRPLTLTELTEAVRRLGWSPDTDNKERAVRAAANRLRHKDPSFGYIAKHWVHRPRHLPQREYVAQMAELDLDPGAT
jgi:hypothetical protein